jgi:hypothetical protein
MMIKDREDVVLVLNYALPETVLTGRVEKLAEFTDSLWQDETYYLYLVKKWQAAAPAA